MPWRCSDLAPECAARRAVPSLQRQFATLALVVCAALAVDYALAQQPAGPTYPIVEPDLLKEIEAMLKRKEASGELARLQKEAIERSLRSFENPAPVEGLARTTKSRTYYLDPSFTATADIVAPDGKQVVKAGTTVNPLDYVGMPVHLLFFDARDPRQVAKAKRLVDQYRDGIRPVATGGSWLELSRAWKRQVYFDQEGRLTGRFGIRQVPALVSQQGKSLRVDELEV